jgi:hypothetical protein
MPEARTNLSFLATPRLSNLINLINLINLLDNPNLSVPSISGAWRKPVPTL